MLNFFPKKHDSKASRTGPLLAWHNLGQPQWTPRRYDQLAEQGYRKNVVAHRCISLIAQLVASIPLTLYDKEKQEIEAHELLSLLHKPNPQHDGKAFLEKLTAHYLIAGNVYIEAVGAQDHFPPRELYCLRPDRMKIVPGPRGLPLAYEYSVNNQIARWGVDQINGRSDILHLKNFHPTDDWYGLAPLEAALLAIDQHNAASQWNMAMLNNGARPSGALVYAPKEGPGTLTEDQVQRLKNELEENYQSSRNTGRPLLLEGGLDWKPLSLSPQEMDWLKGRDMASRDIALAFGVPPQLIGVPDAQTYANYQEARLALYEDTILPLAYRLMGALGAWLTDLFHEELTLTIDADAIAALTARRDTLWEKLRRADFLTLNEKRAALGYSALPEGDQIMPHAADKN